MKTTHLLSILGLACLPSLAFAADPPPAQVILYGGTTVESATGPAWSVQTYGWFSKGYRQLSMYAGPTWTFMDDKLTFSPKLGVYGTSSDADLDSAGATKLTAQPVVNVEALWENGDLMLDAFADVYWPWGAYLWLQGEYKVGAAAVGVLGDATYDINGKALDLNVGPSVGVGNDVLSVRVAPSWRVSDAESGFNMRLLLSVEFPSGGKEEPCKGCAEEKAEPCKDGCPDCQGKDGDKKEPCHHEGKGEPCDHHGKEGKDEMADKDDKAAPAAGDKKP